MKKQYRPTIKYSILLILLLFPYSGAQGQAPPPYGYNPQPNPNYIPAPDNFDNNPNFVPNQPNPNYRPISNQAPQRSRSNLASRYSSLVSSANNLISKGQIPKALPLLLEARTIKPNAPGVHFLLGLTYDQLNDPKKALPSYAKCLNLAKSQGMDSTQLRVNLGNALIKLNHLKEAFYDYQRAIEIEPNNGIPHLYLGRAYLIKEDFNMALDEFRKCEELGLQNVYLPFFKSLALSGLKKYTDARLELRPLLTSYNKSNYPKLYQLANSLNVSLKNP